MISPSFITTLCLGCTITFALGNNDIPAHIVAPLSDHLNPSKTAEFQANDNIVRSLNHDEQKKLDQSTQAFDDRASRQSAQAVIDNAHKMDQAVDSEIQSFIQQQQIPLSIHAKVVQDEPSASEKKNDTKPSEEKKEVATQKTTITSDDGLYIDNEKGEIVYMKNVKVRNPSFTLDCTGPLHLYLATSKKKLDQQEDQKKQESKKSEEEKEKDASQPVVPGGKNGFNFDEIKTVTAVGDVVIHYTDSNGDKHMGKADKVIYDAKTGDIVLYGKPYINFDNEKKIAYGSGKDDYIRVYPNLNVYFKGNIETDLFGLNMQKNKKDQKGKNKK